jgi:hypothetical protein
MSQVRDSGGSRLFRVYVIKFCLERQTSVTITLLDAATNLWACAGVVGYTNAAATTQVGGSKALSATLDRIRLFIDGTQQFDAGTFNILYE